MTASQLTQNRYSMNLGWTLTYELSLAFVTNYNRLAGVKPQKLIPSHTWRPEAWNQGVGMATLLEGLWENPPRVQSLTTAVVKIKQLCHLNDLLLTGKELKEIGLWWDWLWSNGKTEGNLFHDWNKYNSLKHEPAVYYSPMLLDVSRFFLLIDSSYLLWFS